MDNVERRVRLAAASGVAQVAREGVNQLVVETQVCLSHEEFGEPLLEELREMLGRLEEIRSDLTTVEVDATGLVESSGRRALHRLAHRGKEPAPSADRDQVEAIEEAPAA